MKKLKILCQLAQLPASNKMIFNQFNIVWESTGADCVDNISQYNVCWCYYIALYQEQIRSLSLSAV